MNFLEKKRSGFIVGKKARALEAIKNLLDSSDRTKLDPSNNLAAALLLLCGYDGQWLYG
jgi:hypothetical protein